MNKATVQIEPLARFGTSKAAYFNPYRIAPRKRIFPELRAADIRREQRLRLRAENSEAQETQPIAQTTSHTAAQPSTRMPQTHASSQPAASAQPIDDTASTGFNFDEDDDADSSTQGSSEHSSQATTVITLPSSQESTGETAEERDGTAQDSAIAAEAQAEEDRGTDFWMAPFRATLPPLPLHGIHPDHHSTQ